MDKYLSIALGAVYFFAGISLATMIAYMCLPDYRVRRKLSHFLQKQLRSLKARYEIENLNELSAQFSTVSEKNQISDIEFLQGLNYELLDIDTPLVEEIKRSLNKHSICVRLLNLFETRLDDRIFFWLCVLLIAFFAFLSANQVFEFDLLQASNMDTVKFTLKFVFVLLVFSLLAAVGLVVTAGALERYVKNQIIHTISRVENAVSSKRKEQSARKAEELKKRIS